MDRPPHPPPRAAHLGPYGEDLNAPPAGVLIGETTGPITHAHELIAGLPLLDVRRRAIEALGQGLNIPPELLDVCRG